MNFTPEESYGEVEKFATTEQGHADVFNRRIQQLVNNGAYLKKNLAATDAIAKGRNQAIVFNTFVEMSSWLTIPANIANLPNGTNLYIVDTKVPDYWWDAGAKLPRELETQKVDLTTIEATIASLNSSIVTLRNSASGAIITLASTGWVTSAYSGYKEYRVPVTFIATLAPDWSLYPATIPPTAAEETAYNLIKFLDGETDDLEIVFLATTAPTTTVSVLVKGVIV